MLKSALLRVQPPAERNGELAQRPLDSRAAVADAVDDGHAADPREAYEELVHLFASRPRKKVRRTPSTAPQQERGRTGVYPCEVETTCCTRALSPTLHRAADLLQRS